MPTRLLAETIDHRQTQAGALADGLGGEERVEGPVDGALRHTAAIVGDAQYHIVAWREITVGLGEIGIQVAVRGLHQQFSTIGHGVAGIDDQVEQGAFQLIGVGFGDP
ncbi:hypothetical protein D3C76_1011000 [compost metagenome]